ncbi:ABC transporter permease subunit [Bengtsoniella intestinalis]|uniref:ABC transporter permease n=1 Tax=Bengtsoniella intestinalis TaxID=3073143 RepID=UPI00391F44AB
MKRLPLWVVVFWLALWQVMSMVVGYDILLPSPLLTLQKLWVLLQQSVFYLSIASTLGHITLGFISAICVSVVLAVASHRWLWFCQLVTPVILVAKSVPVASFIILILIWFSSSTLSVTIAFIMVLPIVYTNVLTAIGQLDPDLEEMASMFALTTYAKVRYVRLPQIMPYFRSATLVGLGLSFKAGIAAEIIGLPKNSIGEQLYSAKLYIDTPNVFAWTVAIVVVSYWYETLFAKGLDALCAQLESARWTL